MTRQIVPSPLLRMALFADAAGSGAAGLLLAAGGGLLAVPLALPMPLLVGCGLFFLAYAAVVAWLARRPMLASAAVMTVVGLNLAWGVESVAALALGWIHPSPLGTAFVLAQAAFVVVMAALQQAGLRRSGEPRAA